MNERRIVFALDDSEHSKYALRWGLDNIVKPDSDKIMLVSVGVFPQKVSDFVTAALGPLYGAEKQEQLEQKGEEFAKNILKEATDIIKSHPTNIKNINISHDVYALKGGDAREVIVDFVRAEGAHMLIMGSRGLGAIKRTLVGSVSEYCMHNAACPVVIVKHPSDPVA